MKASAILCIFGALMFVSPVSLCGQDRSFPVWVASRLSLNALWERSPIIAIGDVVNSVAYGEQFVQRLPVPVSENLHTLYWCEGDFISVAVIKGELRSKKRFLWASVNPGCKLFYGDPQSYEKRATRIWFLRVDGQFLRPQSDGAAFFYGLLAKRSIVSGSDSRKTLGRLLLTPSANAGSLEDYSDLIWDLADFACSLLGTKECLSRIRGLSELGNQALRGAACSYLRVQHGQSCQVP